MPVVVLFIISLAWSAMPVLGWAVPLVVSVISFPPHGRCGESNFYFLKSSGFHTLAGVHQSLICFHVLSRRLLEYVIAVASKAAALTIASPTSGVSGWLRYKFLLTVVVRSCFIL